MLNPKIIFVLIVIAGALSCKKSPSADSGMSGMHSWSGISVEYDSTKNDTSILSPFAQGITVLNDTTIELDGIQAVYGTTYQNTYTLNYTSTNYSEHTMTFAGYYFFTGASTLLQTYTSFTDSIIYNYSNGSMVWYRWAYGGAPFQYAPPINGIMHTP